MSHESSFELRAKLRAALVELPYNSEWQHYWTRNRYVITGHAILEATDEVGVIYACQDGNFIPMIRPAKEWREEVITAGIIVPRFTPI